MPKLDGTHLPQRLAERLADLKSDKEVAARDVKALLNEEQIEAMDAAWQHQQALRKVKRARTKEEEKVKEEKAKLSEESHWRHKLLKILMPKI
jgi:hypothetical protein